MKIIWAKEFSDQDLLKPKEQNMGQIFWHFCQFFMRFNLEMLCPPLSAELKKNIGKKPYVI
jgi:hypothetical protein